MNLTNFDYCGECAVTYVVKYIKCKKASDYVIAIYRILIKTLGHSLLYIIQKDKRDSYCEPILLTAVCVLCLTPTSPLL